MKTLLRIAVIGAGLALVPALAEAKGCIKGAIVGGLGGHYVGHGVLGAAAGCLIGRHEARRYEAQRRAVAPARPVAPR